MKILVVDDSSSMRVTIRKVLTEAGYEVEEAADGIAALKRIFTVNDFDLVTLDVEMPRMDGFETCRKLRDPKYHALGTDKLPVVFITGKDTIEDRRKGFEAGATQFLIKDFIKDELVDVVNQILVPEQKFKDIRALLYSDSINLTNIMHNILTPEGVYLKTVSNRPTLEQILSTENVDLILLHASTLTPELLALPSQIASLLEDSDLPVIYLLDEASKNTSLEIFRNGGTDFITLPFAQEELKARLHAHLKPHQLNRKLKSSIKELHKVNRLKDSFLSVCSHDLRSPLTGILGFADLLIDDHLSDEQTDMLKNIKQSGLFLLDIINDLLDLSKIQSENQELELTTISLDDIIEESVQSLKYTAAPKKVELISEQLYKNVHMDGNHNALLRIVNNLLSNAIKFTPSGGKVTIALELTDNQQAVLKVADTGIGIPQDKIPLLFSEFSKLSQPGTSGEKGTGLGLSITKKLTEMQSGHINVESEEGKGSTFTITFPIIAAEKVSESEPKAVCEEVAIERHLNILLVEDNPVNQTLAKKLLTKRGHHVEIAENGEEAVKFTKGHHNDIDLVLMDMLMPVMDGLEATKTIRDLEKDLKQSELPIVAMTANIDDSDREQCISSGMNGFISKPIQFNELDSEINRVLKA